MGKEAASLLRYALRNAGYWCVISTKERTTLNAIATLERNGAIIVDTDRSRYMVNLDKSLLFVYSTTALPAYSDILTM